MSDCMHINLVKSKSDKFYHCSECNKPFRISEINVTDPDAKEYFRYYVKA